jgi:sugar lactone lactonase YvrE
MVDIKCVWEEPAILGEGPLWVARENAVYWVDIVSKKVHRHAWRMAPDARGRLRRK